MENKMLDLSKFHQNKKRACGEKITISLLTQVRALIFVQNSSMYHVKGDYIHHALDVTLKH